MTAEDTISADLLELLAECDGAHVEQFDFLVLAGPDDVWIDRRVFALVTGNGFVTRAVYYAALPDGGAAEWHVPGGQIAALGRRSTIARVESSL